jgi:hypothetical protein
MTSPAGNITVANFWSGARNSAGWTVQLRDGRFMECFTQGRAFLRLLKRAVASRNMDRVDTGTWTLNWTRLFHQAARRLGGSSVPFTEQQTLWTPEMLRYAIWFAFYRGQIGTTTPDAITLPPGANLVLPRSGVVPPDDGTGNTFPRPSCAESGTRTPEVVHPESYAPTPPPHPEPDSSLPSNFWGSDPNSARWTVQLPEGWHVCATSARMFLRDLKGSLSSASDPSDPGMWTSDYTDRLHRALEFEQGITPPFGPTQTDWSPVMLKLGIWYAYYRGRVRPEAISLPGAVVMPRSNVAPPNDGAGRNFFPPRCVPVSTPTNAPGSPAAPLPSPPSSADGPGDLSAAPSRLTPAAIRASLARVPTATWVKLGVVAVVSGALGVYLAKRY